MRVKFHPTSRRYFESGLQSDSSCSDGRSAGDAENWLDAQARAEESETERGRERQETRKSDRLERKVGRIQINVSVKNTDFDIRSPTKLESAILLRFPLQT